MVTQPHTKSTDSQNWFSVIKIRYHWSKSDITGQTYPVNFRLSYVEVGSQFSVQKCM